MPNDVKKRSTLSAAMQEPEPMSSTVVRARVGHQIHKSTNLTQFVIQR